MNQLTLDACLTDKQSLRFTPAGIPVVQCTVEHHSEVFEMGIKRAVSVDVRCVSFGPVAERMQQIAIGSTARFSGFIGPSRNRKGLVFHIQDIHTE